MNIKGLNQDKMIKIDELHNGNTFIVDDELYIIIDIYENEAFNLCDNCKYWFDTDHLVKQVNSEIKIIR